MSFFGNKRRDFSIQPPRQQVDGTPFFVTDSANIDFTLENLNLTANLTLTGVAAGTYGDATHIPILEIDQWGRVTGVTTTTFSASGIALEVNGTANASQTILNLTSGTDIQVVDLGGGVVQFNYTGTGGTYTSNNGITETANNFQLGGTLIQNTTIDASTFLLDITGTDSIVFKVKNTSTGIAGYFEALSGGAAIAATSSGRPTITSVGVGVNPLLASNNVLGATDEPVAIFSRRIPSGSVSIGTGAYIDISLPRNSTGTLHPGSRIITRHTSVGGTFDSTLELWSQTANSLTRKAQFLPTGQLTLDSYGQSPANFPGTPVWSLGVDASGNVVEFTGGGGGSGTVISVAATVPNPTNPAFSVNVPNPTTTPSIDITANGIVSQYIRGDGSLANFPTTGGGGSSVSYYLNGSVNQGTFGGSTYYQMSKTPVLGGGTTFTRLNSAGNGLIAQFITDAGDPNLLAIPAGNWNLELFFRASSGGGSPSYYVELYKYDTIGLTFTLIATDVLTPEGITNGAVLDAYFTALAVPQTTLALTDRIALRIFVTTSGRNIELHTENGHLCQIITTFTTGITALNGLTDQVQNFATPGTSGTAPNWNSVSPNHTLNIPLASVSSVTAGLISKAEYDTFNGKQDALTTTKSVKIVSNNVELDGDNASPGANQVYGTNGSGVKVWKADPTGGGNSIGELTADVTAGPASSPSQSVPATLNVSYKSGSCGVVFDGQGGVISNGRVAYVQVPYKGTITGWTLVAAQSGSCTVTVFKDTFLNFPPVSPGDNIFGTQPALVGVQTNSATGLSVAVASGDWIGFTIFGVTTVTWVNLTLSITKII